MRNRVLASVLIQAVALLSAVTDSLAQAPWGHAGWLHRISVVARPERIEGAGTFTDFPLLLSLSAVQHASVFAGAKPDGSDLLITTSDGVTILPREVVGYSNVSQTAEIWIRVGAFSKTQNEFYLYYGNPAANLPALPSDAWGAEYRVIYHFADDPGGQLLSDSSPQNADAVLNPARLWTTGDRVDAKIHKGWFFNGTSHHINTTKISTQSQTYALSAWLLHSKASSDFFIEANPGFWHLSSQVGSPNNLPDYADGIVNIRYLPKPVPVNSGYHHFLWAFDAVEDTLVFYFDGVPRNMYSFFPQPLPSPIYSGRLINPTKSEPVGVLGNMFFILEDVMDGGADEYRIREGQLSASWVLTEYRNQNDAAAFYFPAGSEETAGATGAPLGGATQFHLRCTPNPMEGRAMLQFSLPAATQARLVIYDVAGRVVAVLTDQRLPAGEHAWDWQGRTGDGAQAAAGVYFARLETPTASTSLKIVMRR